MHCLVKSLRSMLKVRMKHWGIPASPGGGSKTLLVVIPASRSGKVWEMEEVERGMQIQKQMIRKITSLFG